MKITTLAFLLSSSALLTAFGGPATAPGTPCLRVKTDKPILSCRTGEEVVFTRTAPARRNLKVLMIGNSFSICVLRQLPQCAAAAGCGLDLCSMYIGGCPLERHWKNVVAATNAAFRPYRIDWNYGGVKNGAEAPVAKCVTNQTGNIPQLLAADDWDVVTLQQASHASWRSETYEPFGGNLVATIRRLAPKAEIVVQETWSYTPFDPRIAKWGLTPEAMYAKIRPAYAQFAAKYGFRVIPTGAAVQDFRRAMPSKDGITGDPCGSPTGHDKFHLNREGEYLQACTWFTTLFRRPAADIAYRPAFLSEARAAQMRRSADAAAALALSAAPVRGELMPNRCEKLPIGAITAEGWLGVQLGQMTEGLCGRLYEKSEFLAPQNGWLTRGGGNGWEEQAYWLRSFAKIAILTRNERMLKETGRWMAALERNADPDGWYGPQELKAGMNTNGVVVADIWPHMVMNEAVLAWWEHTGDRRWFELVNRFLLWCQAQADTRLIPPLETVRTMEPIKGRRHWGNWTWRIQNARAADLLPVIYRVYGETGDARLLNLAQRVYRKRKRADLFLNHHNVNFAQLFSYGTLFGRQSKNPADLGYADHWYGLHMAAWGAMIPRQGFAADENTRLDCYDPRYGTETCTWAEFVRSFSLLGAQTGETKWADRAEDVVFNWCPISYTPGWKELHYITAGNQVNQDAQHDHNYQNAGPMAPYSATSYRCCRHNAALALPEFTEHLTLRTPDGLVFWTYAPHAGKATVNGREVTWRMTTHYPFDAGIALEVKGAKGLALRYRVPGWAEKDAGKVLSLPPSADGRWTLTFDSKPTFRSVIRTGAVMVEKGPLTYSVALKPEVRRGKWVEVVPAEGQRWNFALDVSVAPEYRARAWNDDCFTFEHAPCELSVAARELPEWTLQDAQPAALQESPALTARPVEKIRFIPMACARSHVTVFPTATADPAVGVRWSVPPAATVRKNRPSAFLK